jgi:anti-sigma regulatory factor (Ser/Thr protein kinase)
MATMTEPAAAPAFSTLIGVDDQSAIGAARRAALALAATHRLGPEARGRLAIVVTEAATNILRHAGSGGGLIVLRPLGSGKARAIEMLALDKGPGLGSVERAMSDGFSTIGTAGVGLGAIQRLANVFELYSQRDAGTAVLARVGDARAGADEIASIEDGLGALCVPLLGETECGDAWRLSVAPRRITLMVADGLGHGHGAAEAAASAVALFPEVEDVPTATALARFDTAARGTRGMALSFVMIDEEARCLDFSGVGNVDGRILHDDESKASHLLPQNGIVGHTMPNTRAVSLPWPVGARLVLHSDGISSRWRVDAYPGLMKAHPALMAGVLFRDFARKRDDATIVVLADRAAEAR